VLLRAINLSIRAPDSITQSGALMKSVSAYVGYLLLGLTACGGNTPPATTTATGASSAAPIATGPGAPYDDVFRKITQGQIKVGHFASADGMVGLVLDRTGATPKVQMDGSKDVIELTVTSEGVDTRVDKWLFLAPDGHAILWLTSSGNLRLVSQQKFDGVPLNSDKAAGPLPEATVRGQYTAPANPSDAIRKKLTAMAVSTKLTQFQPEDSGSIAKITQAFAAATPDMFVHVNDAGAKSAAWAPASYHLGTEYRGASTSFATRGEEASDTWDKSKTGLMKYGIKFQADPVIFGQFALHERRLKGWPQPLPTGTPGIVWELFQNSGARVFVTVDGGRYEVPIEAASPVDPGWGAPSAWPAPMQHAALDGMSVALLANGKAMPDQARIDLEKLESAWNDCVQGVWKATQVHMDKVQASTAPADDKAGKLSGLRKTAEQSVPAKCGAKIPLYEGALVKLIEARNVERKALLAAATARAPK